MRPPMVLPLVALVAATIACSSRAPGSVRPPPQDPSASFDVQRLRMVDEQVVARGVTDPRVREALVGVRRHEFVPPELRRYAYEDRPLPIGLGQTISQPYIVGLMTELLEPEPGDCILEVGTGSGYQAAVLSGLVAEVYSIELLPELAESAAERLDRLGYDNVTVRAGDGYLGWPEHGPFDGILVTAGADHIPPPLVEQLRPGARMIIPVGEPLTSQVLKVVVKREDGGYDETDVIPVIFVPLLRN
jgi:protein-L-isoaspartate(D-aspartate) O-methyltransferase